jgi:hypothetical protein
MIAKFKENQSTAPPPLDLPLLELTTMELPDGSWCVVSNNPLKPLTQEQADNISIGYLAIARMLM